MQQEDKAQEKNPSTPQNRKPSTRPPLLFIVILVLFMFCVVELASYLTANILQDKWVMYEPDGPINATVTYDEYLEVRDPILGWPRPYEYGGELYTEEGAIRFPPPSPPRWPWNTRISDPWAVPEPSSKVATRCVSSMT